MWRDMPDAFVVHDGGEGAGLPLLLVGLSDPVQDLLPRAHLSHSDLPGTAQDIGCRAAGGATL